MPAPLDPRALEALTPGLEAAGRLGELERRIATLERASRLTDVYAIRAGHQVHGGGILRWTGAAFGWTTRFIVIDQGGSRAIGSSVNSYFDISPPPVGTVITGVGGAANVTVDASGNVPIPVWTALYYVLPLGGASTSLPANFRIVGYTADVDVPAHWVRIAAINSDDGRLWVNGVGLLDYKRPFPFSSAWTNYSAGGAGENPCTYWKSPDGMVHLEGLAINTAIFTYSPPTNVIVGTLPAGYRPSGNLRNINYGYDPGNGTYRDAASYIDTSGNLRVYIGGADAFATGAVNSQLSLDGYHFRAAS